MSSVLIGSPNVFRYVSYPSLFFVQGGGVKVFSWFDWLGDFFRFVFFVVVNLVLFLN